MDPKGEEVRRALSYLWACAGKLDPDRFIIAVDFTTWIALGGSKEVKEMTYSFNRRDYKVVPMLGLTALKVALLWQG